MKAPDRVSGADYERKSSGGARNVRFPVSSKPESVVVTAHRQQLGGDATIGITRSYAMRVSARSPQPYR